MQNRRNFLKSLGMISALILSLKPALLFAEKKMAIPLEKVSKLKEVGTSMVLKLKNKEYLLVRDSENTVKVLDGNCTHKQCNKLSFNQEKQIIQCGCHESSFDLTGKPLGGPAKEPLHTYTAELKDGKIILSVGE